MKRGNDDDRVTIRIDLMLNGLTAAPAPSSPSIYRVSDCLRSTNNKAYEPTIIAIGPYHHNKDHLKSMEDQKIRYLKLLLQRRKESSVERYVNATAELEEKARKCYAEPIALEKHKFVQMLLLDGIFIIEFLRQYNKVDKGEAVEENDPIFHLGHIKSHLLHDLVLFENQIPLFIIEKLFKLTKIDDQEVAGDLIWPLVSATEMPEEISFQDPDAHHLLGLIHGAKCSSFTQLMHSHNHDSSDYIMQHINSATELTESGIAFEKCRSARGSWLDIRFENKTIYIPTLGISDVTESWFRNMIAYEYHLPHDARKYVTDYTFFLHCLIHSQRDAQLLRRCEVISNWLGGDEMVYHLVKQVGTNVKISEKFCYLDVFRRVNEHCGHRRNRWVAILRRDYFNSPWKSVSFVAAVVLLAVAIVQMVFAILSYRNDTKKGNGP